MLSMILGIVGIAVCLILLCSSLFIVKPNEARFVFTWVGGAIDHTVTTPGLKIKMPWPLQSISGPYSLAQLMVPVNNRCRSKDEAFFDLEVTAIIQRDRKDVESAVYSMDDPLTRIAISVSEAVKRVVPTLALNEVYEDREAVKNEVLNTLNGIYKDRGYECLDVIVEDPKLEKSMEDASNQRIENKRRAEAAEDLATAIFLEETAEARAAAESLKLRTTAAGESKSLYTDEIIKSIKKWKKELPDLDPKMLMGSIDGLDRRDSIISASKGEGSVVVIDTSSERGHQYADMAAMDRAMPEKTKADTKKPASKTAAGKPEKASA